MAGLTVAPCSRKAAEYAVTHWHYSRKMPAGKLITFGVWENNSFIGTVIFGRGAAPALMSPYGLTQAQGCELVRVALTCHEAPVSQIVAATLRQLRDANPGLRIVVSFADPAEGHKGGIYQAGNWTYTGTMEDKQYFVVNGKAMHPRSVGAAGWVQSLAWLRNHVDPKADVVEKPGKHRYVMPLDRAMRRKLQPLAKPYPPAH